jgi:hypothetical protein
MKEGSKFGAERRKLRTVDDGSVVLGQNQADVRGEPLEGLGLRVRRGSHAIQISGEREMPRQNDHVFVCFDRRNQKKCPVRSFSWAVRIR